VHRFTLRGISAIPEVAFVCRRAEPDLMEMDESSVPVEEWWKLAYLPDSDEPLQVVVCTPWMSTPLAQLTSLVENDSSCSY
jgi:hypothetical protein